MRDGRLLAESAPDALMAKHGKGSLEDVFLELCRRNPTQEEMQYSPLKNVVTRFPWTSGDSEESLPLLSDNTTQAASQASHSSFEVPELPSWRNIKALTWKNFIRLGFVSHFIVSVLDSQTELSSSCI
jgi:hypothetical protein